MKLHKLAAGTRCPVCKEARLFFAHEEPTGDLYHCAACGARVHHEWFAVPRGGRQVAGCRLVNDGLSSIRFDSECAGRQAMSDPPRCA